MGDKTITDSAEPRLESFCPPFVDSYILWYVKSKVFVCENVNLPPKTGVETWFQIAGVAVNFSYLVCECVKIVISNRVWIC